MTDEYRTKTGRVLTDADIQALADEAEQGYDVSDLGPNRANPENLVRWRRIEGAAQAMHRALNSGVDLPEGDGPMQSRLSWEMEADAVRAWHRRAATAVILYVSGVAE